MVFLQMAEGLDDETWKYHLRRGDYEAWLRETIKDPELAGLAAQLAGDEQLPAANSKGALREKIQARYTLPV
jgi:hypothetical protein